MDENISQERNPEIHLSSEVLNVPGIELQKTYFSLKLYELLGVNVPNSSLKIEEDKTILSLSQEGSWRYISDDKFKELSCIPEVQEALIAHIFLNNLHPLDNIKFTEENKIIWFPPKSLGWKYKSSYRNDENFTLPFWNSFEDYEVNNWIKSLHDKRAEYLFSQYIDSNITTTPRNNMIAKISNLSLDQIKDLIDDVRFPKDYARIIFNMMLVNIDKARAIVKNNAVEGEINSNEEIDNLLTESPENVRIGNVVKLVEEYINQLIFVEKHSDDFKEKVSETKKLSTGEKNSKKIIQKQNEGDTQDDLLKNGREIISEYSSGIDSVKFKSPTELMQSLDNINNYLQRVNNFESERGWYSYFPPRRRDPSQVQISSNINNLVSVIEKTWETFLENRTKKTNQFFQEFYSALNFPINEASKIGEKSGLIFKHIQLDRFITTPTSKQIQVMEQLLNTINASHLNIDNLEIEITLKAAKRLRREYIKECSELSQSIVSHVTPHNIAKDILRDGVLLSGKAQESKKGEVNVNSPAGRVMDMHSISFYINTAEMGYGGDYQYDSVQDKSVKYKSGVKMKRWDMGKISHFTHKETDLNRVVAFISPATRILPNKSFCIWPATQGSRVKSDELQLFDSNYSLGNSEVGAEVDVEEMDFIVPEEEKDKWENFLLTTLEKGGAGKSNEWINAHLLTYPENIDLDVFLRENHKSLALRNGQKSGCFTFSGNRGQINDVKNVRLFKWQNNSTILHH